jgi:hypothetical protein
MFSIRLLPLFAIGCAGLPNHPGETTTEPGEINTDPGEINTEPGDSPQDNNFQPTDFSSLDENEVRALLWDQIMALHDLDVVQVGDVILDLPEEAICAYGWTPCTGFEADVLDALRAVGPRLEELNHLAEFAVNEGLEAHDDSCAESAIEANLEQLTDLEIVMVGNLIAEEPERNCPYSVPCEEDIALAEQITCERAEALDRIVELTEGL